MEIVLHADDLGRSRSVNDGIIDAVDNGPIESVSVLVNGAAIEEALSALRARPHVQVALHFNLTEGVPESAPEEVSNLVDDSGHFVHSPFSLARSYYFSSRSAKETLRAQVRREFEIQLRTLHYALGTDWKVRVDSHNHVHMLPFVIDEITDVLNHYDVEHVRLVSEPLYLSGTTPTLRNLFRDAVGYMRLLILSTLAIPARKLLRKKHMPHKSVLIGLFRSGRMTEPVVLHALAALQGQSGTAEIIFHPGGAASGEEMLWSGAERRFRQWYFSSERKRERQTLLSAELYEYISAFKNGSYRPKTLSEQISSHIGQIIRFGVTGALAAFVHLTGLYVFTEFVGIWYIASSALGFGLGFIVSFSLQKYWTFEDHETDRMHGQVFKYFLLQLMALATNLFGMYVLVEVAGLWYMFSQILILLLVAVVVFFMSKYVIFNAALRRARG